MTRVCKAIHRLHRVDSKMFVRCHGSDARIDSIAVVVQRVRRCQLFPEACKTVKVSTCAAFGSDTAWEAAQDFCNRQGRLWTFCSQHLAAEEPLRPSSEASSAEASERVGPTPGSRDPSQLLPGWPHVISQPRFVESVEAILCSGTTWSRDTEKRLLASKN